MPVYVSECYYYPLKSGKGIAVDQLQITPRGPRNDRLWMLVHAEPPQKGLFITQRDKGCAKMVQLQANPEKGGGISFSIPGGKRLSVRYAQLSKYPGTVEIWGEQCEAMDAGDEAAHWFSSYLDLSCRLVRIPDDYTRVTEPAFSRQGDQVSFADKYPVHITNEASLESLQKHLPSNAGIGMDRFRPNLVLKGLEPFEEDVLHEIKIREVGLEFVKPSIRCSLTTIDQATARSLSDEPLRTLGRVRRGNGGGLQGVFFGQNAIPRRTGTIRVGDRVEVLSRRPVHPALNEVVLGVAG